MTSYCIFEIIMDDGGFYNRLFKTQGKDDKLENLRETYNLDTGFIKELKVLFLNNKNKTLNEFITMFNKEFKTFDFYFKVGIMHKLNDINSVTVRSNELVPLGSLPSRIKLGLEKRIEEEKEHGLITSVILDERGIADYWILHIQKRSKTMDFATEYAHRELIKSLGVLNFLNEKYILSFYKKFHTCYTVIEDNKHGPIYRMSEMEENYFLTATIQERLNKIASIFNKDKKSDIDKRIVKAFDIYSQIQRSTEPISKIVIYMTILENLLIDKNDRDYLNWKLADRVAFLIGNKRPIVDEVIYPDFKKDFEGREATSKYVINKFVKDLYDIRSHLVHSNKSIPELDMYDKYLLIGHNILIEVIAELLDLEDRGITELKGKGGLIEYLDFVKYN